MLLVDMLVILHFECTKGAFGGLGQIGLPEVSVQLIDNSPQLLRMDSSGNATRIGCHHNMAMSAEVRRFVRYSLSVSRKLMWLTIEGHDTANS